MVLSHLLVLFAILLSGVHIATSYYLPPRSIINIRVLSSKNDRGLESIFRLSELFGKFASKASEAARVVDISDKKKESRPRNLRQVADAIKNEYENIFWATGDMDLSLWADNCTFADPFSSFGGKGSSRRFKSNADNLGRFLDKPQLKVTSFEIKEDTVSVGWIFKSTLLLPWRPVLAAAGETFHRLNTDTLLIEDYKETWKSDPWDVVKRLFVPGKSF